MCQRRPVIFRFNKVAVSQMLVVWMIFMAIWNLVKNENRELPNFDDLRVVFFFFLRIHGQQIKSSVCGLILNTIKEQIKDSRRR